MGLTPHLALLGIVTTGIGVVMSQVGRRMGVLRMGHEPRRCPSCGRLIEVRVCPYCTEP